MAKNEPTYLNRSHSTARDHFFRVVANHADDEPVLLYFWFDTLGWLYGLIKIFESGEATMKLATEAFPLSVGPFEIEEFEADQVGGTAARCSADEYFAIAALVSRLS